MVKLGTKLFFRPLILNKIKGQDTSNPHTLSLFLRQAQDKLWVFSAQDTSNPHTLSLFLRQAQDKLRVFSAQDTSNPHTLSLSKGLKVRIWGNFHKLQSITY